MKRRVFLMVMLVMPMIFGVQTLKSQNKMKDVLTEKEKNLVTVAALAANGEVNRLGMRLGDALDAGVAVNELKEAFTQLYAYAGFPRCLNALACLQNVLQQREKQGIKDTKGKAIERFPKDYDALAEGTRVQSKLVKGEFHYDFAPSVDYFLKAHLFGDIFSSDVLSYQEREMVTIAALASMDGTGSQLKSHVRGAENMGVRIEQIRAVADVLKQTVGSTESKRVEKVIAELYDGKTNLVEPLGNAAFALGEPNTAYEKYFVGNSYLAPLSAKDISMSNVSFEPACRNNWHIHHGGGQILICVYGEGWYQEWGKEAQKLHKGDVVNIPPEVKHWHGATADSWFQHIAIAVPAENASTEWLEKVSDEDYGKLK